MGRCFFGVRACGAVNRPSPRRFSFENRPVYRFKGSGTPLQIKNPG